MSIRARIIGAALLVVAIGSTLYSLYFLQREASAALQRLYAAIDENDRLLKVVMAGPLYDGNLEQLNANLDSFFSDPDMVRMVLREYDGDIYLTREREPASRGAEEVRTRVVVSRGIDELGEISTVYSTALIEQRLRSSRYQLLLFSLSMVVGLAFVIYLVARGLTGPIDRLSEAARAMADGNLDQEIGTPRAQELASLGESFDRMRDAIREKMADLAAQNEALRESEERLRLALMAANQGLYDLELQSGEASVSPEYESMLGYAPGRLQESRRLWLDRMHPEDRDRVAKEFEAYRRGERSVFSSEFRQRNADGEWRWMLSVGKIVERDEEGRPLRMLGIQTDISERKRAEEEKEALETQLAQAQKMESIGRLAGGVAHDFNNMLSVILGQAELMRFDMAENDPALKRIDDIERAAFHSRDITRQLLAFSRKQIIAPELLDLNELIQNTNRTLARLIGEDIELRFYPGQDLWPVKFDSSQIDQILVNMAANARDAMPDGGKLTIETSNVYLDARYCRDHMGIEPGHYVMLGVSDTGIGMDEMTLSHLFEPFFTTKGLEKGTGLGLATVYGAVRQNGGFINVHSEPQVGTSFKIYLPRGAVHAVSESEGGGSAPVPTGTGTILLVEDDSLVRTMIAAMLEEVGYDVLVAKSAAEALNLCQDREQPIDLLLTDVVMPSMSGTELEKKIKEMSPGIEVLFMSGYTDDVIVHHGVVAEGVNFIHKPFSLRTLAQKVRAVLTGDA